MAQIAAGPDSACATAAATPVVTAYFAGTTRYTLPLGFNAVEPIFFRHIGAVFSKLSAIKYLQLFGGAILERLPFALAFESNIAAPVFERTLSALARFAECAFAATTTASVIAALVACANGSTFIDAVEPLKLFLKSAHLVVVAAVEDSEFAARTIKQRVVVLTLTGDSNVTAFIVLNSLALPVLAILITQTISTCGAAAIAATALVRAIGYADAARVSAVVPIELFAISTLLIGAAAVFLLERVAGAVFQGRSLTHARPGDVPTVVLADTLSGLAVLLLVT